ncbi:hypothetical protein N836_06305 [Leptolyngbya sp. Heron Island J]|uniref:hypothetical protein n=1 Tax=Leptolyngbya sp. Heron Island J TaxID=1385935 RepID=UPI0003B9F58F|nr:hypothetical protein [Leptolyngbya sp. Heron Island J]ESA36670.1 hypothetical protein N836_06305 [Leptolyngbya sp. Heron Island J]
MSTQTRGKTVFLLASMVGWLLSGGALIYLTPFLANQIAPSDTTHLWMENLTRGGYNPILALAGGGSILICTIIGNAVWYRYFENQT